MATTPVFFPRKSHGQWRLADYSPWGHRKSDTMWDWAGTHVVNYAMDYMLRTDSVHSWKFAPFDQRLPTLHSLPPSNYWNTWSYEFDFIIESTYKWDHTIFVFLLLLLLLLLLSHFSRVRFRATPEMAAHQAPLSLGFSRKEHWSGLPFPSPMHESEKWKWSCSVVSDPQRPH